MLTGDAQKPRLHRREIVFIFTALSTSFFGGILYSQNLNEVGRKKEIPKVLIGCGLWQLISVKLLNAVNVHDTTVLLFIPNLVSATVLSSFAWNYQLEDVKDYVKRPVWIPLIILAVVYGLVIGLILDKK